MSHREPTVPSLLRIDALRAPGGLGERILESVRERGRERFQPPLLDIDATPEGVARIGFGRGRSRAEGAAARRWLEQAREELAEYLAGERAFFSFALDLSRVAPFQRAVLDSAQEIPLGEVRGYGWVARQIGNPRAVRAVGTALGTNPVPLVVPCHRVIHSDGTIGGFGGGLPLKRWLLRLEREMPALVGSGATHIVCRRGCQRERRIPQAEQVVFASVEEARAVGYRPCVGCKPV
ncbi:MAG TPA: methylated-DNA--[protein]-cysteine S-methyltransferase [Candidatus Bathyarchaeia archaeon]|nr:methylated-DNA--[protein]-cysteine S-methyltransferase [Candidatus Bathyarchaeia archaeon]